MNRHWLVNRTNPEYISYISRTYSISSILAQVLVNRGIKTAGDISGFLNPGIAGLSDPYELPGMKAAVERIKAASVCGETIIVHGDYDTDGLTATAIMVSALRIMGIPTHYFIPNRKTHGYGFNRPSVDAAKTIGATLVITVDCGISSTDAVAYAKREGIDVIVTDHHEPLRKDEGKGAQREAEMELPDAISIINPKLNPYVPGLHNLSGAGIAFKTVQAFALDPALPFSTDDALALLDLAALGTLADVVPLTGENRIIVRQGLQSILIEYRPGIGSLMEVSGLRNKEIRACLLSFTMVPRINAAGRIGDASDVVNLFLSHSAEDTLSIAERLDRINAERQRIEGEVYQDTYLQLDAKGHGAAIVLHGEGWHIGVIGIVASRIAEKFHRPAFVFSVEGDIAKGSVRSIPGFDVYQGLSECKDILISFGGHKQAAGVKIRTADLPAFEEKMEAIVKDFLKRGEFVPTLEIDASVTLAEINSALVKELALLEPVGYGNPEPLLGAKRLDILSHRVVGNNHIKMRLKQRSSSLEAIGFDMGKDFENLSSKTIDAVFTPTITKWNGAQYLQLTLKAFRSSE